MPNRQWILILALVAVAAPMAARAQTCADLLPGAAQGGQAAPSGPGTGTHGLALKNLDRAVSPCKDFFEYSTGGWMKTHQIPAAYPSWGLFNELSIHNQQVLRSILEQEAANRAKAKAGSNDQKLGDYYASCMNTAAVEAASIKPLEPEFRRIDAISTIPELESEVARLQAMGVDVMFDFGSDQDYKNSSQEIAEVDQGGLGMPDRDDYLKTDAHAKRLRAEYVTHVTRMFELMGDAAARAAAEATTVMKIETQLAKASMTRVELRDPNNTYHKMGVGAAQGLTPHFVWTRYFRELDLNPIDTMNVAQPKFFQALDADIASTPLADWKTYLRWHLVHHAAPALSQPFVDENFHFYGAILEGEKQLRPRWQRCVQSTDANLGEALGEKYVAVAFPPSAKAAALKMVHNLIAALHEDLETLPWMSPATRAAAIAKLDKVMIKIGYPDKWRSYAGFHVVAGPYVENLLGGTQFAFRYDVGKIGKPVDRTEWEMTPPTVNAYYDDSMNEIVFPAGILQPPFFDPKADDALNYGGIGAVIGHEMTHGFDDEGRKFDANGNLKNWWTAADLKNFQARAQCVAHQFDSYVAVGDVHENGNLVLGESIADLGGLTLAYRAFEKTEEFKSGKTIQGFTPQQRFFLAYGRIWTEKDRPQLIRLLTSVDPHPISRFRVIGTLSNMPQFASAFGCTGNDAMVRPAGERCKIW